MDLLSQNLRHVNELSSWLLEEWPCHGTLIDRVTGEPGSTTTPANHSTVSLSAFDTCHSGHSCSTYNWIKTEWLLAQPEKQHDVPVEISDLVEFLVCAVRADEPVPFSQVCQMRLASNTAPCSLAVLHAVFSVDTALGWLDINLGIA